MTETSYTLNKGLDDKTFRAVLKDIKTLGGRFDTDTKVWTIDHDYCIVQMHQEHAESWNRNSPSGATDPMDTTAKGVIAARIGRWTTEVEAQNLLDGPG